MNAVVVNLDEWREAPPETLLNQAIGMAYFIGADIERREGMDAVFEHVAIRDRLVRYHERKVAMASD